MKVALRNYDCSSFYTELMWELIRDAGEVRVEAKLPIPTFFRYCRQQRKVEQASENNSFKPASSVYMLCPLSFIIPMTVVLPECLS